MPVEQQFFMCFRNILFLCLVVSAVLSANANQHRDQPSPFAPAGVNSEGEVRAPILMELRRDLVPANGPAGLYGICTRVYRVLHHTRLSAGEECRRHLNSRQAGLCDMSEFYHTLVDSGRFNQTLEFPLADLFGSFSFRASFVYLSSKGNKPAVMIETVSTNNHVLCVESIKCPEPPTTIPQTTTAIAALKSEVLAISEPRSEDTKAERSELAVANTRAAPSQSPDNSELFWEALLSGTQMKSWFLATVSLSILSAILLFSLLATWIYVCRIRRLYVRRRCRGTCRFGCRCPPDVVRQTVTNAAVFGPLDPQNPQLFQTNIHPQTNGSLRSGSGYGTNIFSGGTMTSSRWGSNGGQKLGSPLYVSLASKPMCHVQGGDGVWQLNADHQHPSSQLHRRRLSQDPICRSPSEGSSVSGHPRSNSQSKPPSRSALVSGVVGTNQGGPSGNPSSIVISNAAHHNDAAGAANSLYYQTHVTNYPYSDGGTSEGFSPVTPHSPNQLGPSPDPGVCFGPIGRIDPRTAGFYVPNMDRVPMSADQPETFNSYGSDSLQPSRTYPIRGLDGDVVNITPPSGFYDPNGSVADSGMVNGSANSSQQTSSNPGGFQSFLAPLYPMLSNRGDWRQVTSRNMSNLACSRASEMVGIVELDGSKASEVLCKDSSQDSGQYMPNNTVSRNYTPAERLL